MLPLYLCRILVNLRGQPKRQPTPLLQLPHPRSSSLSLRRHLTTCLSPHHHCATSRPPPRPRLRTFSHPPSDQFRRTRVHHPLVAPAAGHRTLPKQIQTAPGGRRRSHLDWPSYWLRAKSGKREPPAGSGDLGRFVLEQGSSTMVRGIPAISIHDLST